MDLGLDGRTAVVCASSQGLGRACATELARAGCTVVINGRDAAKLDRTAEQIGQETSADIIPVAVDLDTADGPQRLVSTVPTVDILINNNGGPPPRDFRQVDDAALVAGVRPNMATPIRLVQLVIDGMVERRFGRIVNITSASTSSSPAPSTPRGCARSRRARHSSGASPPRRSASASSSPSRQAASARPPSSARRARSSARRGSSPARAS